MKKIILVALSVVSFQATATETIQSAFTVKAFNLLQSNARKMKLTGDINKNTRLKTVVDEVVTHAVVRIFDDEENETTIRNVDMNCEKYALGAKCVLAIYYKSGPKTDIDFVVGLDSKGLPSSILENRVNLKKGY